MVNNLNCFTYFRQLTNLKKSLVMKNQNNNSALATLVIVFFFWGFIAAGNSVFIPFCKSYFNLDQFQSQLVDFAFYGAYYLGALFLFILGSISGKDFVGNWGYKKSIVFGLPIYTNQVAEAFWNNLKSNPKVTVTIDTFHFGLVFFRKEQVEEHFILRA